MTKLNMKEHDNLTDQLRELRYPDEIDVVDAVMAQVRKKPYMMPARRRPRFRLVAAVAAVLIALVGVHTVYWATDTYRESQISDMMVDVYDYHADYDITGGQEYVELAAVDEFLYE